MNRFSLAPNDNSSVGDSAASSLRCRCRRPFFCRRVSKPCRRAELGRLSSEVIARLARPLRKTFLRCW